ncbi:MAG: 50S ribosomal protein L32 [Vampirovibrionales bacterium]|nr:50S ribosomal protein L32 [Vampirovibrionales bacterium]
MPVPKKRLSRSNQNSRRANWKAIEFAATACPACATPRLAHVVCSNCGYYRGRVAVGKLAHAGHAHAAAPHVHDEHCNHDHD